MVGKNFEVEVRDRALEARGSGEVCRAWSNFMKASECACAHNIVNSPHIPVSLCAEVSWHTATALRTLYSFASSLPTPPSKCHLLGVEEREGGHNGRLRSNNNQQSRRADLPARLRRRAEQAEHQRLPRPRRHIPRRPRNNNPSPPPSPPSSRSQRTSRPPLRNRSTRNRELPPAMLLYTNRNEVPAVHGTAAAECG